MGSITLDENVMNKVIFRHDMKKLWFLSNFLKSRYQKGILITYKNTL